MIEEYRKLIAQREGRKEGLKKYNDLLGSVFTEGRVRISRKKKNPSTHTGLASHFGSNQQHFCALQRKGGLNPSEGASWTRAGRLTHVG